jgi:hypothetical protein
VLLVAAGAAVLRIPEIVEKPVWRWVDLELRPRLGVPQKKSVCLARPGGNITGISLNTVEVAAKRVQILKETVPGISRLIVFWDAAGRDSVNPSKAAAQILGLQVQLIEFKDPPYDYEPEMILTPNRPWEMESMVTAMRAAIGGGMVSTAQVAKSWMRLVTAASPAIRVNYSRL